MRIGDLRRRVNIQTRSSGIDSHGQQQTTWADLLTSVPADIQSLSGRELLAAQAVNTEITHTVVLRYHASLADPVAVAAMRCVYVNAGVTRLFNVASAINVDERNRTIELWAGEGLNQG